MEWACLPLGIHLLMHYAWLMDDAFIYFRYADNFLWLKTGLVYNGAEYVEGFSSPLWMLLLTLLRATGLNWWTIVQLMGILSYVGLWVVLIRLNRRLLPPHGWMRFNAPLLLLTLHYGALSSFTSGLETPLLLVFAALAAYLIVDPSDRTTQLLLGFSFVLRPELLVPLALLGIWCWWRNRTVPWALVASSALLSLSWMTFRIVYYAELLPNTYHLKNGLWVDQGLRYLANATLPYQLHFLLFLAATAAVLMWRSGHRDALFVRERVVMFLVAGAASVYAIKIGGDFLHFRYLAFASVLALCAFAGIWEAAVVMAPAAWRPAFALLLTAGLGLSMHLSYPHQLLRHPYHHSNRAQLVDGIEDRAMHRLRPDLKRTPWSTDDPGDQKDKMLRYRSRHQSWKAARYTADGWCVRNYANFRWHVSHYHGLTDPILARMKLPSERPGHRPEGVGLSFQLMQLRADVGPAPGMFERALAAGVAPDWVLPNLETLQWIDRRVTNRHDPLVNLKLALRRLPPIELVSPPPPAPTRSVPSSG